MNKNIFTSGFILPYFTTGSVVRDHIIRSEYDLSEIPCEDLEQMQAKKMCILYYGRE